MRRAHDRTVLGVVSAAPALGRPGDVTRAGRVPIPELLVVGLLVLVMVPTILHTARSQVSAERARVVLAVTSDPSGASVIVDNVWVGLTPLELELERDQEVALRVEAKEPYLEYDLYKPYRTTITMNDDRSLAVWIPRTTAEEQAAQLAGRN